MKVRETAYSDCRKETELTDILNMKREKDK
jgi:hypothetical protein